jgi:AraC-like DNA-binding protein
MDYRELPPPPGLRHVVHCFWFLRGAGEAGETQTLVPDGRSEIVIHLRQPFALVGARGDARAQASVLAAGQLLGPLTLAPSSDADVVGIRFRTEAANAVLGGALEEVTGLVAPLSEVRRGFEARLLDAAAGAPTPESRAQALSRVLARVVPHGPAPLVRGAVAGLERHAGGIGDLARGLGTTARTLERRVRHATGLSPRALRAVLRFRRLFRRLDRSPAGSWARVAVESGYYDQSHMIREFRRFAGVVPGRFFGREASLAVAFAGGD